MCMGHDGSPQVIYSSKKSRSDSTDGLGELSVSGLAHKSLQEYGVFFFFFCAP